MSNTAATAIPPVSEETVLRVLHAVRMLEENYDLRDGEYDLEWFIRALEDYSGCQHAFPVEQAYFGELAGGDDLDPATPCHWCGLPRFFLVQAGLNLGEGWIYPCEQCGEDHPEFNEGDEITSTYVDREGDRLPCFSCWMMEDHLGRARLD